MTEYTSGVMAIFLLLGGGTLRRQYVSALTCPIIAVISLR